MERHTLCAVAKRLYCEASCYALSIKHQWCGMTMQHDKRHGGPFDRGAADSWYSRGFAPHYWSGATNSSLYIGKDGMTEEEISAYTAGWDENEAGGGKKQWA
jgi:hypothetical protein